MNDTSLQAGDPHYQAYVGPPGQYDIMGATQFRLLTSLGLRASHRLLDFGCGSLRAGRLLIPYLDEGRYFGIDPNQWLIDEGIRKEIGGDLVRIKKPRFANGDDFSTDLFGVSFDFIVAQSIFSHTGRDLLEKALRNFRSSLADGGLVAATFYEDRRDFEGEGWIYPHCVRYRPSTIRRMVRDAGMVAGRIPWHHPRQVWYLMAKRSACLPSRSARRRLSGIVLERPTDG